MYPMQPWSLRLHPRNPEKKNNNGISFAVGCLDCDETVGEKIVLSFVPLCILTWRDFSTKIL